MIQKIEQDWGQDPLIVAVLPANTKFRAVIDVSSSVDVPGVCRVELDDSGTITSRVCLPPDLDTKVELVTRDDEWSNFVGIKVTPGKLGDGHAVGFVES